MAEEPRKPGPVDLHVSQRLRERRIEAGMSQETLAEHLGLTFQQVQKYEKGTNRVPSGTLFRASIALGVPVAGGPHMFNFAAAEQLLAGAGAGRQVSDAGALVQTLADWLADPALRARCGAAGAAVVAANRGALARLLERLDALLPPAAAP